MLTHLLLIASLSCFRVDVGMWWRMTLAPTSPSPLSLPQEDLETAIDFFFNDKIWNTIQTNCPHILRYVTIAVIIAGKKKKNLMRELVKILSQEQGNYSDPVTEFLIAVYIDFDFDVAAEKLKLCATIVETDFFTQHIEVDKFMERAHQILFDCCCRIHKCLDIESMCERLQIKEDKETKIIEMIRNVKCFYFFCSFFFLPLPLFSFVCVGSRKMMIKRLVLLN